MLYIINLHKFNGSNLHNKHDNRNMWKYTKVRPKYKAELYINITVWNIFCEIFGL